MLADIDLSNNNTENIIELSVSEAIRKKKGYVKVNGRLVGQSPIYNRISALIKNAVNVGMKAGLNIQ